MKLIPYPILSFLLLLSSCIDHGPCGVDGPSPSTEFTYTDDGYMPLSSASKAMIDSFPSVLQFKTNKGSWISYTSGKWISFLRSETYFSKDLGRSTECGPRQIENHQYNYTAYRKTVNHPILLVFDIRSAGPFTKDWFWVCCESIRVLNRFCFQGKKSIVPFL